MAKKGLLVIVVVLLLTIGCTSSVPESSSAPESNPTSESNPKIRYLPDGHMVLLQSSGVNEAVTFPDAYLEMTIREEPEDMAILAEGESIYTTDLEELLYLEAPSRNITDLTGIENCINLQFVDLRWNNVSDVSYLARLPGVTVINQDEEGSEIGRYTFLRLELDWNQIRDTTPLSNLSSTDYLSIDLSGNGISNVTQLSSLSGLRHLYLQYNDIEDVSALGELSNLTILALGENHIEDVSALAQCPLLTSLSLWNNEITDISPLTELENLTQLTLDWNLISELPSLLGKWQQMTTLILSYNQIKDASAVKDLPETCEVVLKGNPLE